MESLAKIQQALRVPKAHFNQFGGFHYRSCEDILEAVKPLLGKATLTLTDEVILLGDRHYVKATAMYREGNMELSVSAWARENLTRKGMDPAQITGACSSYARKYAMAGLFCLSDGPDPDAPMPQNGQPPARQAPPSPQTPAQQQAQQARQEMSETFSQPTHQPQTTPSQIAPATNWPTPNKQQREFMQILVDYYKTQQAPGYQFSKQKLAEHTWANLSRWASSENDVVLVKQYVTALDVMVQTHG